MIGLERPTITLNRSYETLTSLLGTSTVLCKDSELVSYWRTTLDGLTCELFVDLLERRLIDHLSLELTKRITIGISTSKNSNTEPRWLAITLYCNIVCDWRVCTVANLLRDYERISLWELNNITLMK